MGGVFVIYAWGLCDMSWWCEHRSYWASLTEIACFWRNLKHKLSVKISSENRAPLARLFEGWRFQWHVPYNTLQIPTLLAITKAGTFPTLCASLESTLVLTTPSTPLSQGCMPLMSLLVVHQAMPPTHRQTNFMSTLTNRSCVTRCWISQLHDWTIGLTSTVHAHCTTKWTTLTVVLIFDLG